MKNKRSRGPNLPPPPTAGAFLAPTHGEISAKAETLWREKGRPEGCDESIWLEAEWQLHHPAKITIEESDEMALGESGVGFDLKPKDIMNDIDELFPGPIGRETTSL